MGNEWRGRSTPSRATIFSDANGDREENKPPFQLATITTTTRRTGNHAPVRAQSAESVCQQVPGMYVVMISRNASIVFVHCNLGRGVLLHVHGLINTAKTQSKLTKNVLVAKFRSLRSGAVF